MFRNIGMGTCVFSEKNGMGTCVFSEILAWEHVFNKINWHGNIRIFQKHQHGNVCVLKYWHGNTCFFKNIDMETCVFSESFAWEHVFKKKNWHGNMYFSETSAWECVCFKILAWEYVFLQKY